MKRKDKTKPINLFGESNNNETMSLELVDQERGSPSKPAGSDDMAPLLPLSETSISDGASDRPPPPACDPHTTTRTQALQLLFGAGGIYASFLYYGSLQEDVFRYESEDGTKFTMAWFLQVLESGANVIFGAVALVIMGLTGNGHGGGDRADGSRKWWGGTPNLPKKPFVSSGFSQVCSKGFTSLALANGLSFPVATLAKSGKMAPVMIGSLILGGAKYG